MRSRSNSEGRKHVKTSLPPGGVVSITSWRLRNPMPRSARLVTVSTRCRRERPRRVQSPDDQGVVGAQLVEELAVAGAVTAGAAGGLGGCPIAAGALQGVDLELGLLAGGGCAGVAKQVSHAGSVAEPGDRVGFATLVSDTGSGRTQGPMAGRSPERNYPVRCHLGRCGRHVGREALVAVVCAGRHVPLGAK